MLHLPALADLPALTAPLFAIAALHVGFWASFTITLLLTRRDRRDEPPAPRVDAVLVAPMSRTLVLVHGLGFVGMYAGVAASLLDPTRPGPAAIAAWAGAVPIVAGAVLAGWTLVHFRSWRLRARLDAGHRLATDGPFRVVRHPIYLALDLLALGTLASTPSAWVLAGAAGVAIGGDLRARAEERLLHRAFGDAYADYRARTWRLVPGLY